MLPTTPLPHAANRLRVLLAVALLYVTMLIPVGQFPSHRGTVNRAVELVAQQVALIMNGTFEPVITPAWIEQVMTDLVTPVLGEGYTGSEMTTPEQFWPVTGLTSLTFDKSIRTGVELLDTRVHEQLTAAPRTPLAVFGYSQSAIIASVEKRALESEYGDRKEIPPVSFTMIGNPLRPNGGFLSRLPIVAKILTSSTGLYATPTDTHFATYDIARQYDMWADFPTYPLNLLADVNALFGLMNHWYLPESMHGGNLVDTISLDPSSPDYSPDTVVQTHGDTTYYLIPSKHLPLLYPLRWIGLGKVADVIEPLLKVFVELGYDRSAPMGQTVRAELFPRFTVEGVRQFVTDLRDASAQSGQAWAALFTPRKPATALPAPSPALTTRAAHAPTVRVSHATNVAAASAAKKDVTTPVPVSCAARAAGVGRYHAAAGSGAQTATRAGERN